MGKIKEQIYGTNILWEKNCFLKMCEQTYARLYIFNGRYSFKRGSTNNVYS